VKFRPEAEVWPLMTDDELKVLAEDIDENGQLEPIYLYEGEILDGRNRWLAMTEHCKNGHRPRVEDVNPDSPIAFVISLNEKRRHLNDSQRQWAGAKALQFFEAEAKKRMAEAGRKAAPGKPASIEAPLAKPQRATADAAKAFGTSDGGVQRAKRVQSKASKKLGDAVAAGALSLGKAEQIVTQAPDKKTQDAQVDAIAQSRMVSRVKGLTGEVEWYTPRRYLDAAVEVMGQIDLDPASSLPAQEHVKAKSYFTIEDDGLRQQWRGRVFLNPPYAMPHIKLFVAKMVQAFSDGEIDEGILLTNNATDTAWFHLAADTCAGICFTKGRISFLQARDGELLEKASPTHGQAFFYFGPRLDRFHEVFIEFGTVVVPKALAEYRGDYAYTEGDE
jgi:phage N-6-adenine-methyltransferase